MSDLHSRKKVLVLKVGTSTLMHQDDEDSNPSFSLSRIGQIVDCVCKLKRKAHKVVIVTSGAVGAGCSVLRLKKVPRSINERQAVAAVGQSRLIQLYQELFSIRDLTVGQLLMTRTDFVVKSRYCNFRNTILRLLQNDSIIPVINENDSVASSQLRFGDNDTFAAHCAVSISADMIVILTDVDYVCSFDPKLTNNDIEPRPVLLAENLEKLQDYIQRTQQITEENVSVQLNKHISTRRTSLGSGSTGSDWGSGGMRTKFLAAKISTAAGIPLGLCNGKQPDRIIQLFNFFNETAWSHIQQNKNQITHGNSTSSIHRDTLFKKISELEQLHKIEFGAAGCELNIGKYEKKNEASNSSDSSIIDKNDGLVTINPIEKQDYHHHNILPYIGTLFLAVEHNSYESQFTGLSRQRRWILTLPICGRLTVDEGALIAIFKNRKSLFAAGIVKVEGTFKMGDAVCIRSCYRERNAKRQVDGLDSNLTHSGLTGSDSEHDQAVYIGSEKSDLENSRKDDLMLCHECAWEEEKIRCLTNFSSVELKKIMGKRSSGFESILGYKCDAEVANRANIMFL